MTPPKPQTTAEHERQITRSDAGRYTKLKPCEGCDKSAGANHYSDERCNTLGKGLVLCRRCATRLAKLSDAEYQDAFRKYETPGMERGHFEAAANQTPTKQDKHDHDHVQGEVEKAITRRREAPRSGDPTRGRAR